MPPLSAIVKPVGVALLLVAAGVLAWLAYRGGDTTVASRPADAAAPEHSSTTRPSRPPATSPDDSDQVLTSLEEKVADTSRRLGPEHARTLALRTKRALWLNGQGRFAESEREHRAVLDIRLRVLGPEHPDTLTSRKFLSAPLFSQGQYTAARAEYDAVLAVRWPTGETEYPGWVQTWRGVIPLWFPKGVGTEPHDVYLSALDSLTRVLILDHPEDAAGLPFRAVVMDHLGRHADAEEAFRENSMERLTGAENPNTLRARHYLDSPLNGQARYAEVEANERDILAIQQRVLGPEHEDVFATRVFLATSLRDQERYEEAGKEAAVAYEGFQRLRGPDDPATVAARELLEDITAPR